MKQKIFKVIIGLLFLIFTLLVSGYFFYLWALNGYREKSIDFESELSDALAIFEYNQSQHDDLVKGCWYDSGDYVVFLPRNTESLVYLSLAYELAESEWAKRDLKIVIDQQLSCVDEMLSRNLKQFRDQASHGVHLPPSIAERIYPSPQYVFDEGEGGDVFLMLSLIYDHLGDDEKVAEYLSLSEGKDRTFSAHCCELGPLVLNESEWGALQALTGETDYIIEAETLWGAQFPSLLALEKGQHDLISNQLSFLDKDWQKTPWPFEYLGGNYDIAGFIALEKLYARSSGNPSYQALSDRLHDYLIGGNPYQFNFTQADYVYHPCYFFKVCQLPDTLINGVYKPGEVRIKPNWENSEVQLVGQAQYVLMKVLYENL